MYHGRIGRLIGSQCIILEGFTGAVLHERNMLVRSGVIDDLRFIVLKHLEHPAAVTHRSNQNFKPEVRIFFTKLKLDFIGIILINIEYFSRFTT